MPQTLTVVHAPIGGAAADHPEVVAAVTEAARGALASGPATDSRVITGGGAVSLVVLHGAGERDAEVHRAAWDALEAGTQAARAVGAPGLGDALPVDALDGTLRGTGISYAEIVMTERPNGPMVALLGAESPVGALNLAVAQAFASPFATPRLVTEPTMRRGFNFEVHDLDRPRKRMFPAPAQLYDLLASVAQVDRYVLKSVVTSEGVVVAAASVERRADILGRDAGGDWPVAVVRTGGDSPTVEELIAALGATPARALAFHVAGDRLLDPVDLLAHDSPQGGPQQGWEARGRGAAQPSFVLREGDGDHAGDTDAAAAADLGGWTER